ncbi:MAG: hypothetical protein JNK93_12055 [Planctomycetia bacterium]|nr:hypothetical protein [Planctomycetia bacterium]
MPTVACPCCRASNDAGPNCRRCSADLSLLFRLESDRAALLAQASGELAMGRPDTALAAIAQAESLRPGDDLARLRAVAHLLNRDFPAALRGHRAFTKP